MEGMTLSQPLVEGTRSGLLAAGNFIVDHVKLIDYYPQEETLASISSQTSSNGGGPYNILKDLAKMKAPFSLAAAGMIGDDADGKWILGDCAAAGIETSRLKVAEGQSTSYTDAFTVENTGRRTFFHQAGANAQLKAEDIDLQGAQARVFYLGYLMLLKTLDRICSDGRTEASQLLERASALGMITVADMVSIQSPDFVPSAQASLPHLDWFLLNDVEASQFAGENLLDAGGGLRWELAESTARSLLERGARRGVVIHAVEGALAVEKDGGCTRHGSVVLPEGFSRGATGAGDAFGAGFIWSIHEGWPVAEGLKLAVCAAAQCLSDPTPSLGMVEKDACLELGERFGFRSTNS